MALAIIAEPSPRNARLNKILITAAFTGTKVAVRDVAGVPAAEREATGAYRLNCSPVGASPVLQTEQGYLFESSAIARHLARAAKSPLYGVTDFEASSVDAWLDLVTSELDTAVLAADAILSDTNAGAAGEANVAALTDVAVKALEGVNTWLETRTFLVGERVTLADIALFATVDVFLRYNPRAALASATLPHVVRHHRTVLHKKNVQKALASNKAPTTIPGTAAAAAATGDAKAAAAPVPQATSLDALQQLPPSSFSLEAFKQEYVGASDARSVAAPFLLKSWDPAGWSAYWCDFTPEPGSRMQFMTAHVVRSWFAALDKAKPFAFGVVLVVGDDDAPSIRGLWLVRGRDGLPAPLAEAVESQLFHWTRIADLDVEAARVTDFLCWDGATFADTPVLEGRAFK